MLAVALSLGSSLVYGASDFLGGLKSRSLPLLSVLLVSQATALVLLSLATAAIGDGPPGLEHVGYGVAAGISEAIGVAALYRGLAVGTMGIVAPVAACAPAIPVAAAALIGELPDAGQGAGIAMTIAGVVLISLQRTTGEDQRVGRSLLFGLVTASGFGAFLLAMDAASEGSVVWALLVARLTTVAIFAILFAARRRPLEIAGGELRVVVAIGVMVLAADALYATASTEGLLSVVAVLSSLYPVVTILLARIYLHERLARLQQIGVVTTIAGAAVISVA